MSKIIGNTVGTTMLRPNWAETDEKSSAYIGNKPTAADGNFLVGNGKGNLKEMTPEEVLSHINGASVVTMTTAEYEAMDESETNANALYILTDGEASSQVYVQNEEPVDAVDGSLWLDMDEEEINGMDIMVPPTTAKVGQTIIVKAIDENGKPIEWEAVDNLRYVASDTEPEDKNVVWIDTTDNTVDYEQVVIDTTLTQRGWAADAKSVGDAIKLKADLDYVLDLENNKMPSIDSKLQTEGKAADAKATGDAISKLTAQLNGMIYVGDTEPTNVVDGMVWVDTSESQSINNENNEVI